MDTRDVREDGATSSAVPRFKLVMSVIAIFLSSFMVMGDAAPSVIWNDVYMAFPDNVGAVNSIIALPQIMIVAGSVAATFLMRKVSKKAMLIVGAILFAVGGIFGASVDDACFMVAMRVPYGVGMALVNVVGLSYLVDVFPDVSGRATIMGLYNAAMAVLGSALGIAAGNLALSGWKNVYRIFWVAVLVIVLFAVFLPYVKPDGVYAAADTRAETKGKGGSLGRRYWVFVVIFSLFNMMYCVFVFFISNYVSENAIGDETFSGFVIAAYTMGGFIAGLIFCAAFRVAGRNGAVIAYALGAACMFLLWAFPVGGIVTLIFGFLFGMAYAFSSIYGYTRCPSMVPAAHTNDSIAFLTAASGIGCFAAPYFATWVMSVFADFHITPVFLVASAVITVCSMAECASANRRGSSEESRLQ